MNIPKPIKKFEPIKYETISFRLNVKEKKYVYDVINRIKELDKNMVTKDMKSKTAFMFMVTLFDEMVLRDDLIKQMIDEFKLNLHLDSVRQHFRPKNLSNPCIYLMEVKDKFLCSYNPKVEGNSIQFKPLKDFPAECESCLDRR